MSEQQGAVTAQCESLKVLLADDETLDACERELIRLKFKEGCSYHEMAQSTGLTTSNVGFILCRALKRLAKTLRRKEGRQ